MLLKSIQYIAIFCTFVSSVEMMVPWDSVITHSIATEVAFEINQNPTDASNTLSLTPCSWSCDEDGHDSISSGDFKLSITPIFKNIFEIQKYYFPRTTVPEVNPPNFTSLLIC